ncbi:MAG: hypothetical protein ACXVCI_22480, partial [Bdellovibrionota bacterium]
GRIESAALKTLTTRNPVGKNPGPGLALRLRTNTCKEGKMDNQEHELDCNLELETTIWEGLDSWLSQWTMEA